jgi:hypothetical protein
MIWPALSLAALLCAEPKPEGLTVSTWVREDIFKGLMVNDSAGLDVGMDKLEAILAKNPRSGDALAWRAGGLVYRAVRAFEGGDRAQFDALYARAKADFAKAREVGTPQEMGAVLAVHGGVFAVLADRVPVELRNDAWTRVRDNYGDLRTFQKAFFDKMPVHFRGEVLSGLAQAEQRLTGTSGSALAELLKTMPDTVYATRAAKWQEKPEIAARTSITCLGCHEAGRLDAVVARQKKKE